MAFKKVPGYFPDDTEADKRRNEATNQLGEGRSNAIGSFTLTANVASTVVSDRRVGNDSTVTLQPTTANAAAALATTYWTCMGGSFTLTHANNAQTDRTFRYAIQG